MGLFKSIGRGFKKSWQPKRWIDYDSMHNNARLIKSLAVNVFKVEKSKPANYSSFAEAREKLGIDDAKLQGIIRRSFYASLVYAIAALSIFFYMVFLIFVAHYMSAFSCFFLVVIALCFSFRESYTCFLFKTEKLTATFTAWLKYMLFSK